MRCAQLPAAAAIGVLLSEESFGHIHFSPNYPVGNPLHMTARRSELAYRSSRQRRQLIAAEVQLRQRGELPDLRGNQLTSVPAAIRDLRAAGCDVYLDDGVTFDE